MGRVLGRLESLDRELQARSPHPLVGTASLHASIVAGGHEWSSYPDECRLSLERRTLPGESPGAGLDEAVVILSELRDEDPEFEGNARLVFGRDAYQIDPAHRLPADLVASATSGDCRPRVVGMTFWTDAAILAAAGIPAVLFGPGGAGLHSTHEYVRVRDVQSCRDGLVEFGRRFLPGA
jgi:acetylornithine deacetylase